MKKEIRIYFDETCDSFLNFFGTLPVLNDKYDFVLDATHPQIVFYRPGHRTKEYSNCHYLMFCKEYNIPDMSTCDYSLQWDYSVSCNQIRFPYYVWCGAGEDLVKPKNYDPEKILKSKTKFCAFVYYDYRACRNQFFDILNSYKHVDAPGVQKKQHETNWGIYNPEGV